MTPVLKDYDYVILDTPPSLGILTVNALVASTHLLVPIQAAYFAIEGTDDLLETYERIRARPNPALKVLGVVITLFDKRTNISKDTHGRSDRCSVRYCSKRKSPRTCGWKRAGIQGNDFDVCAEITRRGRIQELAGRLSNVSKRIGLPVTLKMRHDAHYVESLTSYSGAAVGRMIRVDQIRPNPDQPRKALGDLRELTESIREKGVLEPLLVRYVPREDCFHIISGERRYHASRAAGCERCRASKRRRRRGTLEIGLIENIQRKDLTPFEEADGLHRLSAQFEYTHEDIAKKIGRARSSVTETLSLRNIPDSLRKSASSTDSLKIAFAPDCAPTTEKKMIEMFHRIMQGGLTRDEARRERREEHTGPQRPQPFIFNSSASGDVQVPNSVQEESCFAR